MALEAPEQGRNPKLNIESGLEESPASVAGLNRFLSRPPTKVKAGDEPAVDDAAAERLLRKRTTYGSLSLERLEYFDPEVGATETQPLLDSWKHDLHSADEAELMPGQQRRGEMFEEQKSNKGDSQVSLLSIEGLALPMAYFFIGVSVSFISTPLQVFMVQELGAEPEAQNTISVLMSLPWSFKLLFGFVSDVNPIFGWRRKPYMILGSMAHALAFLTLALMGTPGIRILSFLMWVATMGQIMVDVMADTLVVERAKFEPEASRGQTQATCYALRFFGSVLGASCGTVFYNAGTWGWGLSFSQVCLILGALPLLSVVPLAFFVWEKPLTESNSKSVIQQCQDIWETVQLKAVWRPMAFVYTYNVLQIPNVAWSSFLQIGLDFKPWALGLMTTAGAVMTLLGIMAFKRFFFHTSWRYIYVSSTCLSAAFSLLQLVLIFHLNRAWGLSDYFFALGDDVMAAYINGIQFLPVCIMYMSLCPGGSEGATYAMLTTLGNIASCVAYTLGSLLSNVWDVSNEAIRREETSGLWKLSLLTSCLGVAPLVLIWLLPHGRQEQVALQKNKEKTMIGGVIFLTVLGASLSWTTSHAVLTVLGEGPGSS